MRALLNGKFLNVKNFGNDSRGWRGYTYIKLMIPLSAVRNCC
jgi:hypothetical protein